MYETVAILAVALLLFSAVSGVVERSWASSPIVFMVLGIALGPLMFGVLRLNVSAQNLQGLAELTLAMVLFADAAQADLGEIRRNWRVPSRLLLVGLPLTIILGAAFALVLFPELALLEIALLAAILAPTDAALGAPVVGNPNVPATIRESLNFESGLNDGICVPVVLILLGYATGLQVAHGTVAHVTFVVIEEIGIGALTGIALTFGGARLLVLAHHRGWISHHWTRIPVLAMAAGCFALAQALGGSGFIACFVGGLLLSTHRKAAEHYLGGAEDAGRVLAMLTWVIFGWGVVPIIVDRFTWSVLFYAVLSLTVIRMAPVYLCLLGTAINPASRLFIGWFGPRGLASIVFAIIVLHEQLPGNETVMVAIGATVMLSVVLHGITATPLAAWIGSKRQPA